MPSLDSQMHMLYKICDEDDVWVENIAVDQWWGIVLECAHGKYHGVSNGTSDPGTAMQEALTRMIVAHAPNVKLAND